MSSLKADFEELRERIRHGRELGHASFEPIYYLVFDPAQIIDIKRQTPALVAKLRNDGWDVSTFSIAEHIEQVLSADPRRALWLAAEKRDPLAWGKTNESIANALTSSGALLKRMVEALAALEGKANHLLLVTDLEALHPYMRIGAIEGQLQGKFIVPTVFLYPGVRTGKSDLKFLGFYPEDGNYRSAHVGG
jgi:hypothetical protein